MTYEGVVVVWKQQGGYGFIFNDVINRRVFFHASEWKRVAEPVVGDGVQFEIGPGQRPGKSDVAVNVRPVGVNVFAAAKAGA